MSTAKDKIHKWFIKPMEQLKDNGDAGFLALMVAMALAERILTHRKEEAESVELCGARIFGVPESDFSDFWKMYRNGAMHFAQPFSGPFNKSRGDFTDWSWEVSKSFEGLPRIIAASPMKKIIRINPWEWLNNVFEIYDKYPESIDSEDSKKLGSIYDAPGTLHLSDNNNDPSPHKTSGPNNYTITGSQSPIP